MRCMAVVFGVLVACLLLHQNSVSAQSEPDLSFCTYEGRWENPKEFSGASIRKAQIKLCLAAKKPITNHHIVFEEYRDAWQELAKETDNYAIPLLIQGGVLHANKPFDREANTGGIRLWEFRDPNIIDASTLTEEERKALGIEKTNKPLALIRSKIQWKNVFIDSSVILFGEDIRIEAIADIPLSVFRNDTNFTEASFQAGAYFTDTSFQAGANFSRTSFQAGAYFRYAQFKDNVDFREVIVSEQLVFDNSNWEKRLDFRDMSVKELHWDSTKQPSNLKGVVDFRDASIGRATLKEIRFHDLANFSRVTFGKYTVKDDDGNEHVKMHPSPQVLIDNTTFEDAANFLHTTFHGSLILRNNRFRKTLDLTGATFDAQNSHLCLSYNRITRLVMGSSHLGNPPNVSPSTQFSSVSSRPLHRSKIRTIQLKEQPGKKPAEAQCMSIGANPSTPEHARKGEEPLQTIYQTLGQAFLDAHDRAGFNEAWYLQTLAERKHTSPLLAWSSWVFLDLPSRYTVDVWRTVWISLAIMAGFAVLYFLEWVVFGSIRRFWCWIRRKEYHPREVHVL
jgi:uncharacterized protein YjbI with pentapeptide repeats